MHLPPLDLPTSVDRSPTLERTTHQHDEHGISPLQRRFLVLQLSHARVTFCRLVGRCGELASGEASLVVALSLVAGFRDGVLRWESYQVAIIAGLIDGTRWK